MNQLALLLKKTKKQYDRGSNPLDNLAEISVYCIDKLKNKAKSTYIDDIGSKKYYTFQTKSELSRPYLPSLFIPSKNEFNVKWNEIIDNISKKQYKITLDADKINKVLYTSAMAFAMCFDLWKRKSRKTPGTHFEVLLGSIMGAMLADDYIRTKHIPLPNNKTTEDSLELQADEDAEDEESVSTDIVFEKAIGRKKTGLVIPAKITTRERIVQPFAHQRILDGVFGKDKYNSVLMCVSEMQLVKKHRKVNEICVPGTIKLFQTHLAKLSGIYYLDPPTRYLKDDMKDIITVSSIGRFLAKDLSERFLR